MRHTILYDAHDTLSKEETIWSYETGRPTSVQTQWDLLGRKISERSEWRDNPTTLNHSTHERWDYSSADWSHTLTRARGPADTMTEEERWFDDNRYQLTLVDVDNQTSAYARWVRAWLKSDRANLVSEETFHDDGRYVQGTFDPLNGSALPWSQVITWTTTLKLVKLAETTHADDDTLLEAAYDGYGTDPAYASHSITYAHNNQTLLLRDEWIYDDTSRLLTEKDPDDKQAWSERITQTNAGGVAYYVKTTDDKVNNLTRVVIEERYNTGKKLWDARLQELKNGRDINREEITLSASERTEEIRDVGGKTDDWWSVKGHFENGKKDRIDTVFDALVKGTRSPGPTFSTQTGRTGRGSGRASRGTTSRKRCSRTPSSTPARACSNPSTRWISRIGNRSSCTWARTITRTQRDDALRRGDVCWRAVGGHLDEDRAGGVVARPVALQEGRYQPLHVGHGRRRRLPRTVHRSVPDQDHRARPRCHPQALRTPPVGHGFREIPACYACAAGGGQRKVKVVPWASVDTTSIAPSCARAISAAM